eukprot:PhF_6_TR22378/c0_g1_i2/m.31736
MSEILGKDLASHSNKKSCYLVIDNEVYDVAPFLESHPGGSGVLLTASGGDATEQFNAVDHSAGAKAKMAQYRIGKLAASTPRIPASEVAKHKREGDAWVVIKGCVYDVSKFLQDHPGGVDILLDECGKDATAAFESVNHSNDARKTLSGFFLGMLEGTFGATSPVAGASKVSDRYVQPSA